MRFVLTVIFFVAIPISAGQLEDPMARRYVSILEQAGGEDYDGALLKLFQLTREVPSFTLAYSRIAAFAFYSHQIDKADSFFVTQMALHAGNALYGRGLVAKYREQYPEAVSFFTSSIRQVPRSIYPYISLAECYRFDRTLVFDTAVRILDSLSRTDPSNPGPYIGLATLYSVNNRERFGLQYISQALALDSSDCIIIMYCRAKIYDERYNSYPRDYREVTALLERTVSHIQEADDQMYASARYFLGLLYHIQVRDLPDAIHRCGSEYTKAYENARRFGNKEQMSMFLGAVGKYDALIGNFTQASERQKKAARIGHELGRRDIEVQNLLDAGFAEYSLGNYREAITLYKKSGELESRSRDNRAYELYRRVADIYRELQDYSHALDYIDRAVGVLDSSSYMFGFPLIMNTQGEILLSDQHPDMALKAFQTGLSISQTQRGQDYSTGLLTLGVANAYTALGREQEAVHAFHRAGMLLDKYADSKMSYIIDLARFYTKYHRLQMAINTYRTLLSLFDATGLWEINYERYITAFEEVGNVFTTAGNIDSALVYFKAGITAIERLRTSVQNEYQAAQLLSSHINLYMNSACLLAQKGKITEAFQIAEQARARTLQDRLFEATMKFSTSIPESLRLEQYTLDQSYQDLNARLSRSVQTDVSTTFIQNLRDSIDIIETNRRRTNEEMIRLSRGSTSSSYRLPARSDISQHITESDAVISYIRTTQGYGAFLITRSGLDYINLPVSRDTLARLVSSVSPWMSSGEKGGNISSPRIRSSYNPEDAARLSALIFSPLKPYLKGKKNLIIVPDDILHYIPFEALPLTLPDAAASIDYEQVDFLLRRYTIHYVPAASMIGWNYPRQTHAEGRLLAIGNPEFGPSTAQATGDRYIQRFRQGFPDSIIVGLPFAGDEIRTIGSLIEGSNELEGSEATVDRFKNEASRYQILHIATHYFIDDRQPLFSKLLFTPTLSGQQASYFQTFELYQMHLNADLTVLSACNTAIGLLQRGEGLNGIMQAFMTAGSPSLVVSLWSVDDQSTSILMKYFYTGLIAGKTKADALRDAKLQLIKDGYGDPMYWAGFILMGDNTPLTLVPIAYSGWGTAISFLVALIILAILILSRNRMLKRKGAV